MGPSRRSRPSLRLVPWPPLWLAASSPLVVTFTSKERLCIGASTHKSSSGDIPLKDLLKISQSELGNIRKFARYRTGISNTLEKTYANLYFRDDCCRKRDCLLCNGAGATGRT